MARESIACSPDGAARLACSDTVLLAIRPQSTCREFRKLDNECNLHVFLSLECGAGKTDERNQ